MRFGPGYSEPPRVFVWLFVGAMAFGPWIYGYHQGGAVGAVLAAGLAYLLYWGVSLTLRY